MRDLTRGGRNLLQTNTGNECDEIRLACYHLKSKSKRSKGFCAAKQAYETLINQLWLASISEAQSNQENYFYPFSFTESGPNPNLKLKLTLPVTNYFETSPHVIYRCHLMICIFTPGTGTGVLRCERIYPTKYSLPWCLTCAE